MSLITTDYVPMDKDNANWLYKMQVLNKHGGIVKNSIRMEFDEPLKRGGTESVEKDTCSYSILCELVEKAKEYVSSHDDFSIMTVSMNDVLTFLREGEISIEYEKEGRKFIAEFVTDDDLKNRVGEWKASLN